MKNLICALVVFCIPMTAYPQMWNGVDTLYGNEWIDFSKTYFKIKVAADGVYRIDYQIFINSNFPIGSVAADQLRLYRYGQQEPLFTSHAGILGPQDFIEFYGEKNRGQVDAFLFEDPENEQVNPRYSMFNDTAVYYLTWGGTGQALRYTTVANDLNNLPTKEPYCWSTVEQVPANVLFKRIIDDEVTYSLFDGVGYAASLSASESPVPFSLPGIVVAAPTAQVHIRYATGLKEHFKKLLVNDTLYAEDHFSNFKVVDKTVNIPSERLTPSTVLKITSPINDRHTLSYAGIRYTRNFDFSNSISIAFSIESAIAEQYIEIQGFNTTAGAPILFDMTNKYRLLATVEGNLVKIKLPASTVERKLILVSPEMIKPVPLLQDASFQNLNDHPVDYVIISNKALFRDPAANDANRVAEYAAYRASGAGGSHVVKVVEIEDLYAQFAYGVRFHPIAVRNFLHWAKHQWPGLEHAFIIGKAFDFQNFRASAQQANLIDSLFFVPNFSTPGADLPFVMEGNHLTDPIMGIGRLAVTKPAEIHDYLQKVIQNEQQYANAQQSIASKAWMKRVIHNSGGLSGEIQIIRNNTSEMASALSSSRFGADVHSFYKTSDDPVQISAYEQLVDYINDGVALWTIYGHSSPNVVDFDIGLPGSYDNYGRYPLMLVMGCFSGICSAAQQGIGEQFVLEPNRGAIAYIATVNYGSIDALHTYGQQFYQRMGGLDYGKSIGHTLAHTISDLKTTPNPYLIAVLHQNLMQGDPAVRVYAHDGPDYVVDPQSVQFVPNPVSVEETSVKLTFDVVNIGENTNHPLAISVQQRLPGNGALLPRLKDTVDAPAFKKTYEYQLPVSGSKIGFNRFFLQLDPDNNIAEHPMEAELNNSLADASGTPGQDVFFYADDVAPVFPPPFAIVGRPDPILYASTQNTSAPSFRYLFEMDTVESFTSPVKVSSQIIQKGGLVAWKPGIPFRDSVVYYWRVARDSLINGQPLWRMRSFIYLPGSTTGWNQSHIGQYKSDVLVNLQPVDSVREVRFEDNAAFINVRVAFRGVNRYPGFKNAYYQGFYGDYGFSTHGINRGAGMMVIDQNTGRAMLNPADGPFNFEPKRDREFFWFDTKDSLERLRMMDFIENHIPNGFYVGLLAFNTPSDAVGYAPQRWANDSISQGKNLFQVLEVQGARSVRQLANFSAIPPAYGLVFRKNHPEYPSLDTIVTNTDATVEVRGNFLAKWALGFMETPVIGPVKAWKSLHWKRAAFDDPSDEAHLSLLAVREGVEDSLLLTLNSHFDTTLEQYSAAQFPYLKLRYELSDTLTRTATPLHFARILYDAIPEGALNPVAHFSFFQDTLQQGDTFHSSVAFANISDAPFDSLLVRLKVDNQDNNGFELLKKFHPLLPGDTLNADFKAATRFLTGTQRLVLEVNPPGAQPEQYHFNNVLFRDFFVSRDLRNPLLDVTFDGTHILDGDLISPKPIIMVSLKDDNRFLALRDTNTFSLTLMMPDGTRQNIPANDPAVLFFAADSTHLPHKNLARLEWRPTFTMDGEYRLLVNGKDATGNESAVLDWSVTFQVITKSALSSVLNYPNPFSTSTCFVYTLTGAESPAHFRIQIMTVGGKIVREITEQEFGPLKPGTHKSDFCWDGKDQYGDQLANGVYLYRMMAKKSDGADFEPFENQFIDGYFKHGFGKMVLMR